MNDETDRGTDGAGLDATHRAAALTATGVFRRFGRRRALDGLDVAVAAGEAVALLGPNGAGKSTFLRAAAGALALDGGTLRVAGVDARRDPLEVRRRVGYVPDRSDYPPHVDFDAAAAFLAPHYPTWDAAECARLASALDVPRRTPFGAMSRGQATRAMLALAAASRPALLLLDEPFGGLDPAARDDVVRGVLGELRAEGRAVVFATHDLDVASRVADRAVVMNAGRAAGTIAFGDEEPSSENGAVGVVPRSRAALRAAFDARLVGASS
jgi:ABC-2 type transport system ATP-binding protein